jgi:hypothetical protein
VPDPLTEAALATFIRAGDRTGPTITETDKLSERALQEFRTMEGFIRPVMLKQ